VTVIVQCLKRSQDMNVHQARRVVKISRLCLSSSSSAGTVQMREESESGIRKWGDGTWDDSRRCRERAATCDGRLFHMLCCSSFRPMLHALHPDTTSCTVSFTLSLSCAYWHPQGSEHCIKSVHRCRSSSGRSCGSTYISDRQSFSHCHNGS